MPSSPNAADVMEDCRAVTSQMLNEPDGSPLGLADQFEEPPLAFDQRQLTQVVAVVLDQVEGVEHHRMAGPPGAQRMEVRPPVIADNYRLTVEQITMPGCGARPQR